MPFQTGHKNQKCPAMLTINDVSCSRFSDSGTDGDGVTGPGVGLGGGGGVIAFL